MRKSVKIRKIIFDILYDIHNKNLQYQESLNYNTKSFVLDKKDSSMIYNISLNSMRNFFFINYILEKYLNKKTRLKIKILLISAITQILYLGFKDYAVTNDTVEIAKIKNLNPALINSLLKNIIKDRKLIDLKRLDYKYIPTWFLEIVESKKNFKKKNFFETISKEPSIHLVFKNNNFLSKFKEDHIKTTELSAFISKKNKIDEINNYSLGNWWVQDFASMLPIYLSPEFKSKKIIDLCSAPGGKAFQLFSIGADISLNDINQKRLKILKENLKRLNWKANISNLDVHDISEEEKYDVVILDAPCSGIGTIRRNPEILFKKKSPNFKNLVKLQNSLIFKAAKLLKSKGLLLYMVCSFNYYETISIKNNFLSNHKNFFHKKFELYNNKEFSKFIDKDGDLYCTPSEFRGYMIDGFYAVKFVKK